MKWENPQCITRSRFSLAEKKFLQNEGSGDEGWSVAVVRAGGFILRLLHAMVFMVWSTGGKERRKKRLIVGG